MRTSWPAIYYILPFNIFPDIHYSDRSVVVNKKRREDTTTILLNLLRLPKFTMKSFSSSTHSHRKTPLSCYFIFLLFIAFVAFLYGGDLACILLFNSDQPPKTSPLSSTEKDEGCDVFEGRWVYEEAGRPLYEEGECPYVQPQLTCQAHGRPDRGYRHWRWQPRKCSLSSFNATLMLEGLRGKRMMFVGDSLNRGQFVSMVCLLHGAIPESAKSMETVDSLTVFSAKDYNATIEFYWAPFLVESNADNAVVHRITDRIVRVRSINKHARHWKGADVLVFNTYLWWMTGAMMKTLKGSFGGGTTKNITEMVTEDAYRLALRRMVKWVEKNMDPNNTRVFFTSMSPSHTRSELWGGEPDGNCYNQTTPIEDSTYWGSASKSMMQVLKEVLPKSKTPITLLNITQLSEYRRDAHTSIYKQQWSPLTPEQIADPKSYADCNHWCLPGLQDTWNELLYTKLFSPL